MKAFRPGLALAGFFLLASTGAAADGVSFPLSVYPCEHKQMAYPETGVGITFLTTHPADDANLYYEQRSWLADSSMILFYSSRPEGGLMGYLTQRGEPVRIATPEGGANAWSLPRINWAMWTSA